MSVDTRRIRVEMGRSDGDIPVGTLLIGRSRGREILSFSYADSWLEHPDAFPIDPYLPLHGGMLHPLRGGMFGCLEDASPDRWGRTLMRRARRGGTLLPSDCLLGVMDALRCGALRFRDMDGGHLAPAPDGVPRMRHVRGLHRIVDGYLSSGVIGDGDIRDILGPAAALGGARPKLSLQDGEGRLHVVKLPNAGDGVDLPLWEKVCLDLAGRCGIRVPPSSLILLPSGRHALVVERFDRDGLGGRIPFASAMTLLGASDADAPGSRSYLDLADILAAGGGGADAGIRELWLRMQFNVLVSNRDDHLRNHGFLRRADGWELSPAYDLEPDAGSPSHCLALDEEGCVAPDPDVPIRSAGYFGLDEEEAVSLTRRMCGIISGFADAARRLGADAREIGLMEPCFARRWAG